MKQLSQFLMEAMNGLCVTVVGDPYSGPVVITKGPHPEASGTDWLTSEIDGRGDIVEIAFCDDNIYTTSYKGVRNEKQFRDALLKGAEAGWEDAEKYGEMSIEIGDEEREFTVDTDHSPNPRKWVENRMNWYNETEVDGDSGYCRILVDMRTKKVIAGGRDVDFKY